jgi:hypothetical protein
MPELNHEHFQLAISYCPEAKDWTWIWSREGKIIDGSCGFDCMLSAYQDAARWMMLQGPEDIMRIVCQVTHDITTH